MISVLHSFKCKQLAASQVFNSFKHAKRGPKELLSSFPLFYSALPKLDMAFKQWRTQEKATHWLDYLFSGIAEVFAEAVVSNRSGIDQQYISNRLIIFKDKNRQKNHNNIIKMNNFPSNHTKSYKILASISTVASKVAKFIKYAETQYWSLTTYCLHQKINSCSYQLRLQLWLCF